MPKKSLMPSPFGVNAFGIHSDGSSMMMMGVRVMVSAQP